MVAVAGATALTRPAAGVVDLLPALATAVTGVAALWWLVRSQLGHSPLASGARATGAGVTPAPRRAAACCIAAGALAAAAAVMGGGRTMDHRTADLADRRHLPAADGRRPGAAPGPGEQGQGHQPLPHPHQDFYRVDTRLTLPIVSLDDYTLTIDGDVDEELTFTFDDLLEMDLIERDITLTCVSNDVGGTVRRRRALARRTPQGPARAGRRRATRPTRSCPPTSTG